MDPRNPLAGIYLLILLFDLGEAALRFLVPVYLDGRGYGSGQIGITVSAFAVATLLVRLPAGFAYEPHRAWRLVLTAGAASTIAFLVAPFTPVLWMFVACMVLDGLGWGIATTALFSMMMSSRPPGVPARSAMGWYVGFTGLGHALAGFVGGIAGDLLGVRTAMLALAGIPFLATLLISWRLPPAPGTEVDPAPTHPGSSAAPTHPGSSPAPTHPGSSPGSLAAILALPAAVWVTCLTAVYLNVMNSLMNTFFPVLGLTLGLTLAQVGSLAGIRSGVSAIMRFLAVPVLKYVAPQRLYLPLLVVNAATTAALPLTVVYAAQAVLWIANGASRGILRVSTSTEALERLAPGQEGLAAAVMSGGLDTGKILAPVVGGLVAEAIGLSAMFHVVPLTVLGLSALLVLVRRLRPDPPPPGPA